MARLEDQVKTLQKQLKQARETIELQADRITELTRQLQGRIEDTPAYKAQMDALYLARLQAGPDGQQAETRTIPNARKPGARRKYSEEVRQQIRERYQAGQSMAQIARETGASKTQIHAIIHEADPRSTRQERQIITGPP